MISFIDVFHSVPLIILLICGLLLMLADGFKLHKMLPSLAGVGILLSAILSYLFNYSEEMSPLYNGMIYFGGLASIIHIFLCLSGVFALFFIPDYLKRFQEDIGEVYALVTFSLIGMIVMATANDLIIIFIGLEVFSICLYIMAGLFRKQIQSTEAGLKYFLLGAFASTFMLYGMALLYGISGTTNLKNLIEIDYATLHDSIVFYPAIGLILVGYLFKTAAFPFHAWTPDVYTGAPTPLAGFMATASKFAVFISLTFLLYFLKIIPTGETALSNGKFIAILGMLAFLSMLYGNIVAAQQTNVKRILAYSSIAHTGYIFLGLCAGAQAFEAVMFYLVVYVLMTIGAFGVIALLENKFNDNELDTFKGLGQKNPMLAMLMSIFLFSLAGIPPLAGFMGKYQVFLAAIQAKQTLLAVLGILTSVIGAYYYIRIIMVMYFQKPAESQTVLDPIRTTATTPVVALAVIAALVILLGVYPSVIMNSIDTLYNLSFSIASR